MKESYIFLIFRRHFQKSLFFCISFHFQKLVLTDVTVTKKRARVVLVNACSYNEGV